MATGTLSEVAEEGGTYPVFLTFPDEVGNSVVPNTCTWSLYKERGTVVNGRLNVTETPSLEVPVVLYGDDLLLERGKSPWRTLVVKATYDSNLGNNLPLHGKVRFQISNLTGEDN